MKNKKIMTIILASTIICIKGLQIVPVVSAETNDIISVESLYSAQISYCKCGNKVISYGYDHKYSGGTMVINEGDKCKGCNKKVPEGEYHTIIYYMDRYFFSCDKCGYSWGEYSEPVITEHRIKH